MNLQKFAFFFYMAVTGELTHENGCGLMVKCSNSLYYEEVKKMSLCRFYLKDVIPSFVSQREWDMPLCPRYGVGTGVQLVQFLTLHGSKLDVQQVLQPQWVHLKLSKFAANLHRCLNFKYLV